MSTTISALRSCLVLPVLAGLLLCLSTQAGHAQYTRPVLSPYLDFFRNDSPILPQYHQFVRPKIELQQTLDRQSMMLRDQQRQLRGLDQGVNSLISGEVRPTGVQAGYMNFSHYYQSPQMPARRTR